MTHDTKELEERGSPPGDGADDVRCACGNLLARWVDGRIELKCRRCKRHFYIAPPDPPDGGGGAP